MWTAAVEKAIVKIDKRKDRKTCGSFFDGKSLCIFYDEKTNNANEMIKVEQKNFCNTFEIFVKRERRKKMKTTMELHE